LPSTHYTVEMLQPAVGGDHAVFFVHPREALAAHHERAVRPVGGIDQHDPRVVSDLILETDEYGNVTRSASIADGR
jgi:hypothetical protein